MIERIRIGVMVKPKIVEVINYNSENHRAYGRAVEDAVEYCVKMGFFSTPPQDDEEEMVTTT